MSWKGSPHTSQSILDKKLKKTRTQTTEKSYTLFNSGVLNFFISIAILNTGLSTPAEKRSPFIVWFSLIPFFAPIPQVSHLHSLFLRDFEVLLWFMFPAKGCFSSAAVRQTLGRSCSWWLWVCDCLSWEEIPIVGFAIICLGRGKGVTWSEVER